MAGVLKGVKATRKTKKPRTAKAADEKYTGGEPTWDDIESTEDPEFNRRLYDALYYYNYYFKIKDLKKHIVQYLSDHTKMTAVETKMFAKASDGTLPITVGSLAAAIAKGMPVRDDHHDYILLRVNEIIAKYEPDHEPEEDGSKPKKKAKTKTIQDRLREKVDESIARLEEYEDRLLYDGSKDAPPVYDIFKEDNVPQSQLKRVEETFRVRQAEMIELSSKDCDPELKEAYRTVYKLSDRKRILAWYIKLFEGLEHYKESKKATRKVRCKKAPSKDKLVAKVKFKKEDPQYKIVGVHPVEIVGAKEVWVFNTKTRKMGKYVASEMDGGELSIKGTTIIGFDPQKSTSKTLRKPIQQLAEFKKANKVALRKYMDNIKTTAIKLNGRLNAETVILKAMT